MKALLFQVSEMDIGILGIKKCDLGKWVVLVQGCVHFKKNEEEARKLYILLNS